jgi:hypothetical protein
MQAIYTPNVTPLDKQTLSIFNQFANTLLKYQILAHIHAVTKKPPDASGSFGTFLLVLIVNQFS